MLVCFAIIVSRETSIIPSFFYLILQKDNILWATARSLHRSRSYLCLINLLPLLSPYRSRWITFNWIEWRLDFSTWNKPLSNFFNLLDTSSECFTWNTGLIIALAKDQGLNCFMWNNSVLYFHSPETQAHSSLLYFVISSLRFRSWLPFDSCETPLKAPMKSLLPIRCIFSEY